jgi:signal transduction histidine kinase
VGIRDNRGTGGETVLVLSVLSALAGGPLAGLGVAAVGWGVFFPLIAKDQPGSLVALPLWTATAYLVGLIASRAVLAERAQARLELADFTAHRLRTPAAAISGLVQALRAPEIVDDPIRRERILAAIEAESERLLEETGVDA